MATYQYDYMGRRTRKTVRQHDGSTTQSEFVYDGWNVIAEFETKTTKHQGQTTKDSIARYYTWGRDLSGTLQGAGGVGGLLSIRIENDDESELLYPTYDANGNITEVAGEKGTVRVAFQYGPFGNSISEKDEFAEQIPFRFSTKYLDGETGFCYYGLRYYMLNCGRWLSRDPIQEAGGANLYGMLGNNTSSRIDILGTRWSNDSGREAVRLAEQIKHGDELAASHPCCNIFSYLNRIKRTYSINDCKSQDCITFATVVTACAYKLNGDQAASSDLINAYRSHGGQALHVGRHLISKGWRPLVYARDAYTIMHPYLRNSTRTGPVNGDDIQGRMQELMASGAITEYDINSQRVRLNPVGSFTNFARWNSLSTSKSELKDQIISALYGTVLMGGVPFAFSMTAGGWHTFILSDDRVFEGIPPGSAEAHKIDLPIITEGFVNWIKRSKYSTKQMGYLLVPPSGESYPTHQIWSDDLANLRGLHGKGIRTSFIQTQSQFVR